MNTGIMGGVSLAYGKKCPYCNKMVFVRERERLEGELKRHEAKCVMREKK